mmetsp:Transcript_17758/g.32678  ORF Transcript_17758/g.32678 Transcript_17758/m.32678 type:complete len:1112 (-) Transcript_17758:172-3507(-)
MLSFLKEAAGLSPEKKEAEAPAEAAAPKDTEIPVARPIEAAATTPNAAAEPATEPATEAAAELAADTPLKPSSEAAPDASPDAVPEASPEAAAESSTSAASESTAQAATQATRELPAEISQLSPEADAEKLPKASEEAASESLPLAAIESTAQAAAPAPEVPAEVPQSAEALPEKLPEASADTAAEASPAAASESTATAAAQATSEAPAEVPPLPAEADPAKLPEASADAAAESSPSAAIESDAKESTPEVLAEIPQLPVEVDAEKSPEAVKTPDCSESVAQAEVDSKEPAPEVATEVVVDAVPEVSPEVVKEAAVEAVVEAEVVSDSVANTDFVEEFQRAPVEASKEAPPEFTACFPDEESKASAESPSKLAGVETLPPFVVESWSDAAPQPNSVDKGESWTASAEEARPELPHTFWQSALPSSTSPVFAFSDTRLVEQPASPAVSAGAPSLPVPPREGFLDKSPGASSGQGTPSPFLLLPPPPPPTSSVGSNSPLAAQVVKIEELKDQKAQEAAPAAKASGSPANAEAVAAAALALGHPTKGVALGMEPKVKAYSSREQPETDGKGASDEETAIVAGAADAEVDDDACELLLGTSENVDPALPSVRGPRGDGVDSDSEEEQEANRGPWHKSLPPGAAAPEPVDNAALEKPQASHSSFQSELHRSGLISVLEDLAPLFPQPVEDEAAEAAEDDGIMEDVCSTGMQLIDAKPILEDVCSTGMQGTPDDSQDIEEAQHTPSDVYFAGDVDPDANDGLESPHKDVHDTITIQELGTVTHLLGQNAREAELLDKINPEDTSPMRREVKLAAAEKDGDLEETLRYSQEVTFEKVGVDVDAGMDDAKQLLLTSDADPAVVVKGELEHLVLDPVEISIHTDNTSIDSPNLDGVWILDKGEPVAVVRGSDVQLFGDGADFETLLQPLGAGVWSITIDDEEFLADCVEREDGTLLLQWSDGLTWERQKEGIVANHSVSTAETAERRDESQSASTSSSSSSSSSSCTSSPCSSRTSVSSVGPEEPSKPCQAGEVVELVQALESNAVGEPGEPGLVYQAEETGEASKAEEAGEVREPSKADKSGEAGEANEASRVGEAGKAGEVSEVGKAGAASKDWERLA